MVIEFQTDSGISVLCVPTLKLKGHPEIYTRYIQNILFSDSFVAMFDTNAISYPTACLAIVIKSLVLLMYCYNVSLSPWSFPETLYISWGNIWLGNCTGMSPLYAPRNKENTVSSNIGMYLYIPSATDRYNRVARVTQPWIHPLQPFKL